jgi:hypothetical protein
MLKGKLVFAQLKEHLPRSVFDRCVARYAGSHAPLKFSYWDQLLCMMFAQLTSREGLRDITTCLRSQAGKLYHAGISGSVSRSTLADANERRDRRIFEDFALHLIDAARALYGNDSLSLEWDQSVYAIDCHMAARTPERAEVYQRDGGCREVWKTRRISTSSPWTR